MSASQVACAELLLGLLVLVEIVLAFRFFKFQTAKYSRLGPPPLPLKEEWPRQFAKMTMIGAIFLFSPLLIGDLVHSGISADFISPKIAFMLLICVSSGLGLMAEGLISGALYGYFFLKYWRRVA
jgi:hypothetical protein